MRDFHRLITLKILTFQVRGLCIPGMPLIGLMLFNSLIGSLPATPVSHTILLTKQKAVTY